MVLCCALAALSLGPAVPEPGPPPVAWQRRFVGSGQADLDRAARHAVDVVRRDDWEDLKKVAERKIELVALSVRTSDVEDGDLMLFDDTKSPAEEALVRTESRATLLDTRVVPTRFQSEQVSYFASLVEGACSSPDVSLVCGLRSEGLFAKNLRGPAVTAKFAPNAAWRIEFRHYAGRWRVHRLVIEQE